MIIHQFYLQCLAHASYLVVDERTKTAAVIDPQRDIDQYLEEAERHGATIRSVFLTHFHADFVAGHLELRERVGATIHLGARADAEYAFTPLHDGDAVEFGDVRLEILETPGHTPEAISIVAYDLTESGDTPKAVFTGDTLFVGDVGRPDLMASVGVTADELAGALYDSLRDKLLALDDATLVYPAHGAGSMCGKNLGSETFSTIGTQRANNYALQPMSKETFVEMVTADQPVAPRYFAYDAVMNKRERPTLESSLAESLSPMTADDALRAIDDGAQVVDARDAESFAASHLAGSVNIGLGGSYATWSGTLLEQDRAIVVVAEPGREHEAAMRLGRIGFDRVIGFVDGGVDAFGSRPELIGRGERREVDALRAALSEGDGAPLVVDVRTPREWEQGHVDGSVNVPLNQLVDRLDELPSDRELAVVCKSGYRSSAASSLLRRAGFGSVVDTVGGMDAWTAAGLPTTEPTAPTCQG